MWGTGISASGGSCLSQDRDQALSPDRHRPGCWHVSGASSIQVLHDGALSVKGRVSNKPLMRTSSKDLRQPVTAFPPVSLHSKAFNGFRADRDLKLRRSKYRACNSSASDAQVPAMHSCPMICTTQAATAVVVPAMPHGRTRYGSSRSLCWRAAALTKAMGAFRPSAAGSPIRAAH